MSTWLYVLVLIGGNPGLKPGHQIIGSKPYFSEKSCAEAARLIAQAMYVQDGSKYGYRCKMVDYEPPKLD